MPFFTLAKNGSSALPPTMATLVPSAIATVAQVARIELATVAFRRLLSCFITFHLPGYCRLRRPLNKADGPLVERTAVVPAGNRPVSPSLSFDFSSLVARCSSTGGWVISVRGRAGPIGQHLGCRAGRQFALHVPGRFSALLDQRGNDFAVGLPQAAIRRRAL